MRCYRYVEGSEKAQEYFAGYLLEQSLSIDNLFVFVLVFNYFKTPPAAQPKVRCAADAAAGPQFRNPAASSTAFSFLNLSALNLSACSTAKGMSVPLEQMQLSCSKQHSHRYVWYAWSRCSSPAASSSARGMLRTRCDSHAARGTACTSRAVSLRGRLVL
jgi:hypothetical protein